MMARLLPATATVVEALDDTVPAPLFAQEEQQVARAVDKRRREFATGRRCGREALAVYGFAPAPLLTGEVCLIVPRGVDAAVPPRFPLAPMVPAARRPPAPNAVRPGCR